ncbi:MAG: ABC transporter permease [Treponema sp.]|jgi:putative ABC transport system permease protein|nr:ABC transporter permease [Treponema sp.]
MNKQKFYIKMVVSSLLRRRSRMIVALLAVAVGAAILSGLITIYYDIPRQMGLEFRSYGANLVFIPSGDAHTISDEDAARALSYLDANSVIGAAPYRYQMIKINEQPFMAAGTDLPGARATSPYWLVSGRWPENAGEALAGAEAAAALRLLAGSSFTVTGTDSLGESFSRDFTITGLLQTGGAEEAFIFMSLEDFRAMMREEGKLDVVECSVSAARETLEAQAARIAEMVPGVSPALIKKVTDSEGTVLTKLQALIYLVTVVVLLLIMICVATTMMAVIAERRREIGLRKALGASNQSLIIEFIGEGMFLGGFGGLLGAVLGFTFAEVVGLNVFNRSVTFQPLLAPVTLAASIIVTAIACIIPVRSAADVDPAVVLRGE